MSTHLDGQHLVTEGTLDVLAPALTIEGAEGLDGVSSPHSLVEESNSKFDVCILFFILNSDDAEV